MQDTARYQVVIPVFGCNLDRNFSIPLPFQELKPILISVQRRLFVYMYCYTFLFC